MSGVNTSTALPSNPLIASSGLSDISRAAPGRIDRKVLFSVDAIPKVDFSLLVSASLRETRMILSSITGCVLGAVSWIRVSWTDCL